jgi:hypothetical protein
MRELRRRSVVRSLALLGAGGLAGCNGSPGSNDGSSNSDGDGGSDTTNATNETTTPTQQRLAPTFGQKLAATDGARDNQFGRAVAVSGSTALVGTPRHHEPNGPEGGAAYILEQTDGRWRHVTKLAADDGDRQDRFGKAVALGEDTAVVAAVTDEDPNGSESGSAYVFERGDGEWRQVQKLTARNGDTLDRFGTGLEIRGNRVLVGSPGHNPGNGANSGAIYVFERSDGAWERIEKLAPLVLDRADNFGHAVAFANETILGGAPGDEDPNGRESGTVYVFDPSGSGWDRNGRIVPETGGKDHRFGAAVAADGNRAVVGAPHHATDDRAGGAAYVFERAGEDWVQAARLVASDGDSDDRFGYSVAIAGDVVLVGAPHDEDPNGMLSGSAYVFSPREGSWRQITKLSHRYGSPEDLFGWSVDLTPEVGLIGTPREDLTPGHSAGSAIVYDLYQDVVAGEAATTAEE